MTQTTQAFLRMDFVEDTSYPMSFVLREFAVVFPVFIYYFIGQLVGPSPTVGGDYFTYVVIGTSVATILQAALNGFGTSLQFAQNRGTFETLLVEPVPWLFLPYVMNLWRTIIGVGNGFLVLFVGVLLGANVRATGFAVFFVIMFLGILASTGIGIVSASLTILAKRSQPVLTLYGLAASLLGGTLFSVSQLPDWLRPFSWVIPHTYVITASREALMRDPGTFSIAPGLALIGLGAFSVVTIGLGTWMFRRSLQYGREMGLLSGY